MTDQNDITMREMLLDLLSRAVEASDTVVQLYRYIDGITNGISTSLQCESQAEYISMATYDYAIFRNGERMKVDGVLATAYPYSQAYNILLHLQVVSTDTFTLEPVVWTPCLEYTA
jgi:hypothetical protein